MVPIDHALVARSDPRATALLGRLSRVAAILVIALGLVVLVGWALDVALLKSVSPGLVTMKANTAVAFVLAGVSLRLLHVERAGRRRRRLAALCAVVTVLIGLLTLSEYLLGWDLRIDQLIFRDPAGAVAAFHPGRMTPATALSFLLLGLALLLLDSERAYHRAQSLSLAAGAVTLLALIGYLYSVEALYALAPYTSGSLHTALAFLVLSAGALFARPERGLMAIVTSDRAGGAMARRLLPAVVVVPIAFGWLRLKGERAGLYGPEFGLALVIVASLVVLAVLIVGYARSLDRAAMEGELADEARWRGELKFRGIVESAPDAIVIADREGRISLVNPRAERMFGYTRAELLDRPVETLLPERFRGDHLRHRATYQASPRERPMGADLELSARRKDGSEFPVEISLSPLEDPTATQVTCVIRDITDVKRKDAALRQSEKLAAMGSLLAGVAHELNNPLSVIVGHARLLALALQGRPAERVAKIASAAERCARIVRNFLALARQHPPERQGVAVGEIAREAIELLAYQLRVGNVEVKLDLPANLPVLWADPHQLHQVFVNLITNAHQAMTHTGSPRRLTITARHDLSRAALAIEVADTGAGMPPEVRSRIFEPFFTTKPPGQGTGLGLALCQGIIAGHGGTISVDSAPGRGTVFKIDLPVTPLPAAVAAEPAGAAQPVRNKTILIADDEVDVAAVLGDLLAQDGHRVEIVPNGARALEKLETGAYDAILSDLRMPELDGPSFYRTLAHHGHPLAQRFVFVTGDALSAETRKFLEETGVPCIGKPFEPDQVRRVLEAVFR